MLGRRTSLVAVAALVVGLLTVAAPAHAGLLFSWSFDERPPGFPVDPALTLVSASALLEHDETGRFTATVELGGVPDASSGTAVRIELGRYVGDVCVPDWSQTVPTYDPGGPATRDGTTLEVRQAIGLADYEGGCGSVTLVRLLDGVELDRLEAPLVTPVFSDEAGRATVTRVSNTRLEPGRRSTVWLRVRYAGSGDAEGLVVSGRGAGVVVRRSVQTVALADGDQVWVPVEVRLLSHRARTVTLRAVPFGDLLEAQAVPMTVRLRPIR